MRVIILAGGFGTRFLPATKTLPKEMLPILNKPLIQYAVEEAREAEIEEFIFITGRGKSAIEDFFDHSIELEHTLKIKNKSKDLKMIQEMIIDSGCISYVRQQEPLGLGHAIWCARKLINDEPFAVILADDLIFSEGSNVLEQMKDQAEKYNKQVLALEKIPQKDISKFGVVNPNSTDGRISHLSGIVEKPSAADAPSDLAVVGRYIFKKDIFSHIDNDNAGKNGEIQITDAIMSNIEDFVGYEFQGERFDCGSKIGYLKANIAYGLQNHELKDELSSYLGDIKNL